MSDTPALLHDPYAALRHPEFRFYSLGRNLAALGDNMSSVAVGWELYERKNDPLLLGVVGLVQAIPIFAFALLAGHVADNYSRKRIAVLAQLAICACSAGLCLLSSRA